MRFVQTDYGSAHYQQAKRLRNDVLRVPLGLTLSDEDTAEDATRLHFVALENDIVIATVSMMKLTTETIKLRQMAAANQFQGKGVGLQLVRYAEQSVQKLGFSMVEMAARDTAVPFYEKLGYQTFGEPFMEVGVPHIIMKRTL
jgi:predicted GNAT family N-acyltransferase